MKTLKGPVFFVFLLAASAGFAQSVNFQSSTLPIVVISTQGKAIVDEPKIMATMGIINNGEGAVNRMSDAFTDYDGHIGIEYRGSSSQALFPKKSFGIETRDAAGNDIDTAFLDMPSEEDWVLYGPYSDKSMMRNKLTFDLFEQTGRYSSRTRFVELVLNGQYHGVYVFMEKIKRDKNRVDIANLRSEENSGDELTGGYIVKLDKFEGGGGDGFASAFRPPHYRAGNQQIFFQYHVPDQDEITNAQKDYIKKFVSGFEQALHANTFRDAAIGYRKYIDVGSFVDFFLINELSRNVDGYRLSTFMYKDKDSKGGLLTMGPIWDFNLAFGNADYCSGGNIKGWAYKFNEVCPTDFWLVPFWWDRLLEDPAFRAEVKLRWSALRQGAWSNEAINERIDQYAVLLADAQKRNFQKWPILGKYEWPNSFVGQTYEQEVDYLRSWVSQRLAWLDAQLAQFEDVGEVTGGKKSLKAATVFPNPFSAEVHFRAPEGRVIRSVAIFTVTGQLVASLQPVAGQETEVVWDGKTLPGQPAASGVFVYRLESNNGEVLVGKLMKSSS